jgi:hypothetical protein
LIAAELGQLYILQFLLDKGMAISDDIRSLAIHLAAQNDHREVVKLLER